MEKEYVEDQYFQYRKATALLLLPSILYRADVQLKLQLAYHALRTLDKHFWAKKGEAEPYKEIRAKLIEAEAYQQMEQPNESRRLLGEAYAYSQFFGGSLGDRHECSFPIVKLGDNWQNVKVRFLSLLIEDYLSFLSRSTANVDRATNPKRFPDRNYTAHAGCLSDAAAEEPDVPSGQRSASGQLWL